MSCALSGSHCSECKKYIPAYGESTGRSTPPYMTVIDDGRMFDGKHVCKECYERLRDERTKEVDDILIKVWPGKTKRIRYKRGIESIHVLFMSGFSQEYFQNWKERMLKDVREG